MTQLKMFESRPAKKASVTDAESTAATVSPPEKTNENDQKLAEKEYPKLPEPSPVSSPTPNKPSAILLPRRWLKLVYLDGLNTMGQNARATGVKGNELFNKWMKEFEDKFDEPASRFDWPMSPSLANDSSTWMAGANKLYEFLGNDMGKFMQRLEEVWDREKMRSLRGAPRTEAWSILRFSHALAVQDPMQLFHFEEEEHIVDGKPSFQNTFWDLESGSNPALKIETPLSSMWLLSAKFLGNPWAFSDACPNVLEQFSTLQSIKKKNEDRRRANHEAIVARLNASRKGKNDNESDMEDTEMAGNKNGKTSRPRKRGVDYDGEDEESNNRTSAPAQPTSPNKQGVRFRIRDEKNDSNSNDHTVGSDDTLPETEDVDEDTKMEDPLSTPTRNSEIRQTSKINKKASLQTATRTHDMGSEEEEDTVGWQTDLASSRLFGAQVDSAKPSEVHPSDTQLQHNRTKSVPEVAPIFKPSVSKNTEPSSGVRFEQLAEKPLPKPSPKTGVQARNDTQEEIEESEDDEASFSNMFDKSADLSNHQKIDAPPSLKRSNSKSLRQPNTHTVASVPQSHEEYNDDEKMDRDPYEDIETTNGVYRRNSLSLEDAMAVDEVEAEVVNQRKADPQSNLIPARPRKDDKKSYASAAARVPTLLPTDQVVRKLLQMNMEGLPFRGCKFFVLFLGFLWNGPAAGMSITKKCLQVLHAFLTALFKSGAKFKLLPMSDAKYKNQKLWIDSPEKLKQLMGTWYQAKNYIDMSFGNADWISSQARTTGNKQLRTRMRLAFDDTYEGAKATIGAILEEEGGKVKDSPLQFPEIGPCGSLPFLPEMMSPEIMANQIMRELNYEEPVALVWEWVSCPSAKRTGTAYTKAPSTAMWNVYTKTQSMRRVGAGVSQIYNPSTPKSMVPYGGISTFFHNWRAATNNLLSVGPYGPVRDMATTLVLKAIDFKSVTETFCSPIPLPGLLKVVDTEKYGKMSLLRFLYSIKATPVQVETAAATAEDSSSDSDSDSEAGSKDEVILIDDDFVDVESKKKKKAKKKAKKKKKKKAASKQANNAIFQSTPEQLRAETRAKEVQKLDADNLDPINLFTSVLPERTEGYACATARLKVLQLALNVWNGLGAFLIAHLEESSEKRLRKIIVTWLGQMEWDRIQRTGEAWDQDLLRATKAAGRVLSRTNESGFDWLGFGEDPIDQVRGYLTIDTESADVSDIDDGATVAGAVDELRAAETMIQDMTLEITSQAEENARLLQEIERLRAAQTQPTQTSTPGSASSPVELLGDSTSMDESSAKPGSSTPASRAKSNESTRKKQGSGVDHAEKARSRRGGGSSAKGP